MKPYELSEGGLQWARNPGTISQIRAFFRPFVMLFAVWDIENWDHYLITSPCMIRYMLKTSSSPKLELGLQYETLCDRKVFGLPLGLATSPYAFSIIGKLSASKFPLT